MTININTLDGCGESCCKGGRWDCCKSALTRCFLGGRNGGVSGVGGVMVVVIFIDGYWW